MRTLLAGLLLASFAATAQASEAKINGPGFAREASAIRRAAARTKLAAQTGAMLVQTRFLRWTPTYKIALVNGRVRQTQGPGLKQDRERILTVSGLGPEGIVNGYGAVPVSAHVMLKQYGSRPFSTVREWSKTDKFQLELEHSNGDKTRILSDAQSTGLVTGIDFNLKLLPGRNVLTYWRNGSAGVAGAKGSRTIFLDYDGS